MKKRIAIILALSVSVSWGPVTAANDNIDSGMNWRIRQEETDHSQIMRLVHQLTDIYGPRLTGSPNFKAASEWAMKQMRSWGLVNDHMEEWDFGHPGWSNDSYSVRVLSPYKDLLDARVVAWTPSTKGLVRARVVQIIPPARPTAESLEAYLASVKSKISGRIVLAGAHAEIPIRFNPVFKRREDADLKAQYAPERQYEPTTPPSQPQPPQPPNGPVYLDRGAVERRIDEFLAANGALAKISDSAHEHGQIRALANRTYNSAKAAPSVAIRNEDYGRMCRILADGSNIEMEIEILNTIHPGQMSWNTIAEMPGTDKKDEVVMLGAHIDSWHDATGATDNATGVAAMMEAARVLQKLGIRPRRTIRVALWGGEEEGLLGSKAYVRDHFGTSESPRPEFAKLAAYINLDSGTGRVRGALVFGPAESSAALREILQPFTDLGVIGVNSTQSRSYGGTDSYSFNWAGLPGIDLTQDPIEYRTDSWHTNVDTYERVVEGDLKQCAIVIASMAYHLSMRDEMLPRFSVDKMPPPQK